MIYKPVGANLEKSIMSLEDLDLAKKAEQMLLGIAMPSPEITTHGEED